MDISILRKAPQDRIRTIKLFDGEVTVDVLFCGREEVALVREASAFIQKDLNCTSDDAYNMAFGRVAIKGWSGLTDNGEPLECNPTNTDLIMLNCAEIRVPVLNAASSLAGGVEKNS